MKIGILTLPLHHNYGGILQAYALQTFLKNQGHEVFLIRRTMPAPKRSLKTQFSKWISKIIVERNPRKFTEDNLHPRTDFLNSNKELEDSVIKHKLNALIVGSDQVWRLEYSDAIALNFFFDFLDNTSIKKISYAASFGLDNWSHPVDITKKIAGLLHKFDAVSVREDSAVTICKDIFDVSAVHMIDPTLLLEKDEYISLISPTELTKDKSLIVYIIDESADKTKVIDKVAARKRLVTKSINAKLKFSQKNFSKIVECIYPTISFWLSGFRDADFIVTDSFHGVAFSLIFNKPFIAIGNKDRGLARFQSILKIFNLQNRLIFQFSELTDDLIDSEIDFLSINEIIQEQRSKATEFITNSIDL